MTHTKNKSRTPHGKFGLSASSPGRIVMTPLLILAAFCLLVIVISLVRIVASL